MTSKVLIAQNNIVQSYTGQSFSGSDSIRIVQFNPQVGAGFTGSVDIEGSFVSTPGANDYTKIMSVTFTGHTANLSLEVETNAPYLRATITSATNGAIAVVADSASRSIQGSQGANPATATIESAYKVSGSGTSFKISSVVVPQFTTDDIFSADDPTKSLTDVLNGTNGATGKQDKIGTGAISASEADVNLMAGQATYGLTVADLNKLADVNASATELNYTTGTTSNIQTQLDAIVATVPTGLGGTTVTAATLNAFFNATPTVNVAGLNSLNGLTADAADLNILAGTTGTFTAADLAKLGNITSTATEINSLSGFTGSSTDLNKIVSLTISSADLNSIAGLGGTTVTATQLGFLSGLTQNVQSTFDNLPALSGLTSSVNDLNVLTGIFNGSGAYPAPVTATEIGYLNGLTSNIQTQLNSKRDISVPLGISEISGLAITTSEANYLQGADSNIQAQIDALTASAVTSSGGTITGALLLASGSAASPSLAYSAATTTGTYLFGANGYGITVAGVRAASFDGTDAIIGDGATTGSPTMKGTGMGVTDPAYSFTGDTDTGIYRVGANSVGIAGGASNLATFDGDNGVVTLGGAAADNNTVEVSGIFSGEKVLGRATVLAGSVTGSLGNTALYTVPTGRSTIITKIYVRMTNINNFTDGSLFRMNIGFGALFDEILDNTTNTAVFNNGFFNLDTVGQIVPLGTGDNTFPAVSGSAGGDYQVMTAASILQTNVTALAGADDYDMEVIVFGHEF